MFSTLTIVIPAYNEVHSIARVLEAVRDADLCGLEREIIIVDDGSTDGTPDATKAAIEALGVGIISKLIVQSSNQGKGAALKRAFAASTGDLLLVQDADMEYDPGDIHLLLQPLLTGRADVVLGSRFMGGHPRRVVYLANAIGNRVMSLLFSLVAGLKLTDIHCCYMVFRGDVIRAIEPDLVSKRWGFNPEICSVLADWKDHLHIVETGISYYGRSVGEGKKIRFRHGVVAVLEILKFNLRRSRPFPDALRPSESAN
jgi:glycosyltransferase involved in cell wall biosynthesis